MPLIITPAERQEVTKIVCPKCKERVKQVGLLKNSKISGLTFICKRCDNLWKVQTE